MKQAEILIFPKSKSTEDIIKNLAKYKRNVNILKIVYTCIVIFELLGAIMSFITNNYF